MNAPTASTNSGFAGPEQSLFQYFSSVHRAPVDPSLAHMGNHESVHVNSIGNRVETHQANLMKRNCIGEPIQRNSQEIDRRCTLDTTTPPCVAAAFLSPSSRAQLPPPPFSSGDKTHSLRDQRPAKKFQRQQSTKRATAPNIVAEKSAERRSFTREPEDIFVYTPKWRAAVKSAHTRNAASPSEKSQAAERQHTGFRGDYSLGEAVRSMSHMVVEPPSIEAISSLKKHDFAFIKRSDGSYSYAILSYQCIEPIEGTNNNEECLVFVINDAGYTKMLRKRHWRKLLRLVSVEEVQEDIPPPTLCQEAGQGPPSMISFVPQMNDDDCSLISNVSDGAMRICMAPRLI